MKVVCKIDNLYGIQDPDVLLRLETYINYPAGDFGLVLGREYTVYGIVFWDNAPLVYVFLDEDDEYPKPVPMDFFELVDCALSKCWALSYLPQGGGRSASSLVFKEWADDPAFYEKLIDGDEATVGVFSKYRSFMDFEGVSH
ncbi:hypothetical protein BVH01_07295 [Pseudomonas sp. PA1(2017)]|uniref:hypothetical protein n=1 Tax=Pseudomonas sp. PA1(2017) TaxID=1932113 RepID=UPI00095B2DF7|nr:hypothetical protein [Pseudomonas sp. PA1(2017)]OLU16394.1 hypothetical protein BVH01_07295 [Pseudomonas sp. PA1(2017)]